MQLSEKLRPELFRKVVTQGYSDISLSVMADYKSEYAEKIANSRYSPQTINKLTKAMADNTLADNDFLFLMECSQYSAKNEPYVDDCLNSIGRDFSCAYASKILAAVEYEDCNYREATEYVKSGAFYPTFYSSLSVTEDTARELADIGVPLRGCEGFNYCYDITDIEHTIKRCDAVFVQDKDLAVRVCVMSKSPDWDNLKSFIKEKVGDKADSLTSDDFISLELDYVGHGDHAALHEKIEREYKSFIEEMKNGSVENAINSAYEINVKNDIRLYAEVRFPHISHKHFEALLSSKNALHEIYEEWQNNGGLSTFEDIETAMEYAAKRISYSIEREAAKKEAGTKEETEQQTVKPKKKSL